MDDRDGLAEARRGRPVSGRGPETAGMKPGTVYTQQLFLEIGWTDTAPR